MKRYRPLFCSVRCWDDIENHYIQLIENNCNLETMLSLVRHIKETRLANRLFAATSLDRLLISIYNPIEWNREVLEIQYSDDTKRFNFRYFPKSFEPVEFERYYDTTEGIEKFNQFIALIKW